MKDLAIVIPVRVNSSRIEEKPFQKFWKSDLIGWKFNQLSQIKINVPSPINKQNNLNLNHGNISMSPRKTIPTNFNETEIFFHILFTKL